VVAEGSAKMANEYLLKTFSLVSRAQKILNEKKQARQESKGGPPATSCSSGAIQTIRKLSSFR
jgi:hypothetical protein